MKSRTLVYSTLNSIVKKNEKYSPASHYSFVKFPLKSVESFMRLVKSPIEGELLYRYLRARTRRQNWKHYLYGNVIKLSYKFLCPRDVEVRLAYFILEMKGANKFLRFGFFAFRFSTFIYFPYYSIA